MLLDIASKDLKEGELYLVCNTDAREFTGPSSHFVLQIQGTLCSQHLLLCHQNVGLSHRISSFFPEAPFSALEHS